jgi:hypothetical protein
VKRLLLAGLCALALAGVAPIVRAEVWGYVDEKGVAHFASEKVDERYELFFRGGQSFDTAEGLPEAPPRPVTVPTAAPKLLAFFEISPTYKRVQHHLREAAATSGIDYALLQALIATESGFDPEAVSPKGAVGLMQVTPATAERYGLTSDKRGPVHKKLADPVVNIRTGTRHLKYLMDLFPQQLDLVLAAYNAGEGAVQRAGNRIPNYRETQNYVKTVLQLYAMLRPPAAAMPARGPQQPPPKRVRVEIAARPAAQLAGGAIGRGNMPPPLARVPEADDVLAGN